MRASRWLVFFNFDTKVYMKEKCFIKLNNKEQAYPWKADKKVNSAPALFLLSIRKSDI